MARLALTCRPYLLLFGIVLACYAYFLPRWADWNQNSRFDLIVALVDQHTFQIDTYVANTGDYAIFDGHYYSDKAPGVALLGVPVYAAFRALAPDWFMARLDDVARDSGALGSTLSPGGTRLPSDKVRFFVGLVVTTFVVGVLPATGLSLLFFWMIGQLGGSAREQWTAAILYALATPAIAYANSLVGHQTSAVLLFSAFSLVFCIRSGLLQKTWLPIVGLLLGYAALTEYPTVLIAAIVTAYALATPGSLGQQVGRVFRLGVGAVPPLVALAIHDIGAFGTPLPIGYFHSALWADVHETGFLSLTYPHPDALWGITFGLHRGLFFLAPYLLLSMLGYREIWRRGWRSEVAVLIAAPLLYCLYNASSAMWQGGFAVGPRYVLAALPFLGVPAGAGVVRAWKRPVARPLVVLAIAWSFFAVWSETLGGQAFPDYTANPLFDLSLPRLIAGDIARNMGMLGGLFGWTSLLPLALWLAVSAALARASLPPLVGWIVGISAVSAMPYLFAYYVAGADRQFMGIVLNVQDTAQYFSWARESRDAILIQNKLTAEPGAAVYFNLFWFAVGRLVAAFDLGIAQTTQLVRPLAAAAYIGAMYWFIGLVSRTRLAHWTAFLVAAIGGGLGWLLVLGKQFSGSLSAPLDVYVTEPNAFLTIMAFPHQAMAGALLLATLGMAALAFDRGSYRLAAVAGLAGLALGLQHGYDLIIVYAVVGVVGLVLARRATTWFRVVTLGALVVGPSIPTALYLTLITHTDPIWRAVLGQYGNAGVYTPNLPHLVILLGLPLLIVCAGLPLAIARRHRARVWLRACDAPQLLVWTWLVVGFLLPYIPTDFQIKMLAAWQVPVAVAATRLVLDWGAPALARFMRLGNARSGRILAALMVLFVLPVNLYLLAWRFVDLNRRESPYFLPRDDVVALNWLEGNTRPSDVVLSSLNIGEYIPFVAGNNAFLAHWAETLDFYTKRRLVNEVFDANIEDADRVRVFEQYNVRYVFYGEEERALGAYNPSRSANLRSVFSSHDVSIYAVVRGPILASQP